MTEITSANFEQMFPIIYEDIRQSSFIAIDTEMTGLVCDKSCTPSLFDTLEARYSKQRRSANKFIVCQLGLSLFMRDYKSNSYEAKTYTFYLCPRSLNCRRADFSFDMSAIEFLAYNHFEFDKFAKLGINYLNEIEEQNLINRFDDFLDIDFIDCPIRYETCSHQVSEWLNKRSSDKDCGNQLILKCWPTVNPLVNYVFIKQLRNNFPTVWVQEMNGKFIVRPIDVKERANLLKEDGSEREQVIDKMIGFSKVFKCLIDIKRPIVGHNMLMDLLLMYHNFYKPLPKKMKQFMSSLHSIFPYIFDTKCMIFNEKQNLNEFAYIFRSPSLGEVYAKLKDDDMVNAFPGTPMVYQKTNENNKAIDTYSPHNAGFDAFATAFVFLKVSHILLVKNSGDGNEIQDHVFFDMLKVIENHVNKINLIRANFHYLSITGPNPLAKSKWLFARKRNKYSKFNLTTLTSKLAEHGTADIKVIDTNSSVLIATNSHKMAKTIVEIFRTDANIKVSDYNVYKHNRTMRLFLWSVLTISSGFTAMLSIRLIKYLKQ
ncbi:poly(A)-specific ribonuclease PNLDC1-like [Oppia nitens]|uniref:poly(A)-specific ribonuclease PNLDC1-like n=1 Tax=Oppia nitens TaxID=1686743 RepID=UPI0023DA52B1|nr:poly(A)-specific ribonuclease PNLDC1-like [Oppia nitens]